MSGIEQPGESPCGQGCDSQDIQQQAARISGDTSGRDCRIDRSQMTIALEAAIGDIALVDISEQGNPANSSKELRMQIRASLGLSIDRAEK